MDDFRRKPVPRSNAPSRPVSTPSESAGKRPLMSQTLRSQPRYTPLQAAEDTPATAPVPPPVTASTPQPLVGNTGISVHSTERSKKRRLLIGGAIVLGIVIAAAGIIFGWYTSQLAPVNAEDTTKQLVTIELGSTPTAIAESLEEKGLIRNATVFLWYTKLEGVQNTLQAGAYRLSPSESTPQIAAHLTSGNVDTFNVTLYPGATLVDTTNTPADEKLDVTSVLKRAGYTDAQITAGFAADYSAYNDTLFQGRPQGADLEGYIYGETYQLSSGATVEDILKVSFDEYWKVIQENNLVAKYKAQGLTLYEGITLASIVQKEAGSTPDDMGQISQVFHSRLEIGMPLGSDPTYQYIADKLGVPRDTNLDSPYNTRRYAGLPPGPIASAGEKALIATAHPAEGDFLYFLSGDDDVTYFAHTFEEHEQNIANHCQKKCQIL